MIRLRVSGDAFDPIVDYLESLAHPDLMPLAALIAPVMVEDNREGLMAGRDWNDDAMAPIEESTRRHRSGDGPPVVPEGEASAAIADYRVEIEPQADRILLIGHWPSTPYIRFHVTGFTVHTRHGDKGVPARDPTGLRAAGRAKVQSVLHDFATTLIGGPR